MDCFHDKFCNSTDELQKSSAYLTEAYLLSPDAHKTGKSPTRAPFNYAFGCEGVGFFGWLEGEGIKGNHVNGVGRESGMLPGLLGHQNEGDPYYGSLGRPGDREGIYTDGKDGGGVDVNPNRFRLERFGKAMSGTESWEVPGAVLHGSSLVICFSLRYGTN